MASAELKENLTCSVCMEIFENPVTLPCGHNFCHPCITNTWGHQEEGESTCPLCIRRYKTQPELPKNLELANLSECYRRSQKETPTLTGKACSYCLDRQRMAVKCCVPCKVSLCAAHFEVHNNSAGHIYSEPNFTMYTKRCSIHDKTLEFQCTEDDSYLCAYCKLEEKHAGHNILSLDDASEKKKEDLRNILEKLKPRMEKYNQRLKRLRQHRKSKQERAALITKTLTDLFVDIRRLVEELEKDVLTETAKQEERVSLEISELIQQMEKQMDELSGQICYLQQLCNVMDPLIVLQGRGLELDDLKEDGQEDKESQEEELDADLDEAAISEILHKGLAEVAIHANRVFHVQKASEMNLDINTAANDVILEDLKVATWSNVPQARPPSLKRFRKNQVLSIMSFNSGKHYWEMGASPSGQWRVGMAYPSIQRIGHQSLIGNNKKSWCLMGIPNEYFVIHDSEAHKLPINHSIQKVRVYLDYRSGQLSFYELQDPIRHLHTFTSTFTEPLHFAIMVSESSVRMRDYRYLTL